MSELDLSATAVRVAVCHSSGCENFDIPIELLVPLGADSFICGPCGALAELREP